MKQRSNVRFLIRSLFALFRRLQKPQEKERFVRSFFYYFNRRRKRAYRELQKIPVLFFIFSSAGRSGGCSGVFVWWLFGGCSGGFSGGFIRLFFFVLLQARKMSIQRAVNFPVFFFRFFIRRLFRWLFRQFYPVVVPVVVPVISLNTMVSNYLCSIFHEILPPYGPLIIIQRYIADAYLIYVSSG